MVPSSCSHSWTPNEVVAAASGWGQLLYVGNDKVVGDRSLDMSASISVLVTIMWSPSRTLQRLCGVHNLQWYHASWRTESRWIGTGTDSTDSGWLWNGIYRYLNNGDVHWCIDNNVAYMNTHWSSGVALCIECTRTVGCYFGLHWNASCSVTQHSLLMIKTGLVFRQEHAISEKAATIEQMYRRVYLSIYLKCLILTLALLSRTMIISCRRPINWSCSLKEFDDSDSWEYLIVFRTRPDIECRMRWKDC